ncbi:MAG: NADH-quinone oxidoreductase subunit H [Bacillota bacterium]|nr:NADH-quinone oxidoreductase subunit H [Bacillota bacterium]
MQGTLFKYILYFIQSLILLLLTPLFIGILKRLKAFVRGYTGFSIFQPYYNIAKLMAKGRIISKSSSPVTLIGPFVCLVAALTSAFMVPVFYTAEDNLIGNLFVIIFILAIIKLFNALLGLDCASTFGGMGSSREMFISMFAEPIVFIIIAFLYMETKKLNIFEITAINSGVFKFSVGHILAAMAFFAVLLAENARMPVDNPETHLELTMIHEAMVLDLSGSDLACIELSSYIKLMVFMTILINCFFPYGVGTAITVTSLIIGIIVYFAKMLICITVVAIIETTMAKFRLFRIPEILAAALSLSIAAIAINYFA